MFQVSVPSNAQLYLREIRKFVDFEMLTPDFLIMLILDEQMTAKEYVQRVFGNKPKLKESMPLNLLSSGIVEGGLTVNLIPFYIMLAGTIVAGMVFAHLMLIPAIRKKVKKQIKIALKKLFFNGIIRGLSISYLPSVMIAIATLQIHLQLGELDSLSILAYRSVLLYALAFPTCIAILLSCYYHRLDEPYVLSKFSNLYAHLNYKENYYSVYYQPVFFMKRLLWMLIPIFIPGYGGQQI